MAINSPKQGWAEQDPEMWWEQVKAVAGKLLSTKAFKKEEVKAIGLSYQMHGLVLLDHQQKLLRPSIIWCDSRAAEIGREAFHELGEDYCLENYLNSPGNFTASKLKWVKENEPEIFKKADVAMLPGDFIGYKMTGERITTSSGLSEGIFWNFRAGDIAEKLLDHYGIQASLLPEWKSSFDEHGRLSQQAAEEMGLDPGIPLSYRAGDQPNNAFSLNVLNPGEAAATAGTSGVIYGITDQPKTDPKSRVNSFVHVNHTSEEPRYGMLLCVNGTGIMNSWLKKQLSQSEYSYEKMNEMAGVVPVGSEGLTVHPFGNGSERILEDRNPGGDFKFLDFHRHTAAHMMRAVQEGIVFALGYGLKIMKDSGLKIDTVKAGHANMFLSPIFREAFVNTTGTELHLYKTDGAEGAARGAGVGAGFYEDMAEAFDGLEKISTQQPEADIQDQYREAYSRWLKSLP
jgi:xylulokinase